MRRFGLIMGIMAITAANVGAYLAALALRRHFRDPSSYPYDGTPAMLFMIWTFAAVSAITFIVIYRHRKTIAAGGRSLWIALALASTIISSVAVSQLPEGAADIYWNTLMSRGWVLHGRNPYTTTVDDLSFDQVYPMTNTAWRGYTMVYGPLWMVFSSLPVAVSADPAAEFLLIKLMLLAAYVASGFILFHALKKDDAGYANLFLSCWLLNPLAIFEIVNAAHNEGLLVLAVAVAAVGFLRRRPDLAVTGLMAAALTKVWPVVLFPFLGGIKNAPKKYWMIGALSAAALLGGSMLLFGSPKTMFEALITLRGGTVGLPWQTVADIAFLVVAAGLAAATFTGRLPATAAAAAATFAFFSISMSWVNPWYVLPALPLCAAFTRRPTFLIVMFGSYATFSFLTYAAGFWVLQFLCLFLALFCIFAPTLEKKKE